MLKYPNESLNQSTILDQLNKCFWSWWIYACREVYGHVNENKTIKWTSFWKKNTYFSASKSLKKKKKVQTRQVAEDSGVRNPRIAALAEVRES